ncbi:chorismate mutase family protein [Streptomyces sp. NPDC090442]|uniref:chorismate mutase family protein n=1 Tax=Streptomyces sp. NPDC090442 TaxID=3365962 RepID=UPI0037FFE949
MATREPSPQERQLEDLRGELDALDERLLEVVRERIEVCVRIARHKSAHGVPMMQPHRIGIVHERAARYGERHGVDQEFLRRLYDVIIEETCRVEDLVMGNTPAH